ncbi:MAG: hypothetical protein IMX00_01210 [Limnochordales bacterium]|nr:hypothetical protein [Limnochordales bacterium]
MGQVAVTVGFLSILWAYGLFSLWRQRAWRALAGFVALMTLGSVMAIALASGVMVLPWSQWLTSIFKPVAELLFGPTVGP